MQDKYVTYEHTNNRWCFVSWPNEQSQQWFVVQCIRIPNPPGDWSTEDQNEMPMEPYDM